MILGGTAEHLNEKTQKLSVYDYDRIDDSDSEPSSSSKPIFDNLDMKVITCPACTFLNKPENTACDICE